VRSLLFATLSIFAVTVSLSLPTAHVSARSISTTPVVSDRRSHSFTVSWVTPLPSTARVEVQVKGRWMRVNDLRGATTRSTSHYFMVPCDVNAKSCTSLLPANTLLLVHVYGAGKGTITLHVHTTKDLKPAANIVPVAGHVKNAAGKPVSNALVYVVAHHGSQSSIPLAVLTIGNGGWAVGLVNAVTPQGNQFPVSVGDSVTVRAVTGSGSASATAKIKSLSLPLILSTLTVR
jgi:hypothetical protein